jgi:hypothetical protein
MGTDTYDCDYDGHTYAAVGSYGDLRLVLLRGECGALVEADGEERPCSFDARYRKTSGEEVEHRCGRHLPEKWENVLSHPTAYDFSVTALTHDCTAHTDTDPETVDPDEGDPSDALCGDRAFLRANTPTGESYYLCRRHTRESWILELRDDDPPGSEYGVPTA